MILQSPFPGKILAGVAPGATISLSKVVKSKDLVKVHWVFKSLFPMTAMDSALVLVVPVDGEVDRYSQQPAVHKAFGCRILIGALAGK